MITIMVSSFIIKQPALALLSRAAKQRWFRTIPTYGGWTKQDETKLSLQGRI